MKKIIEINRYPQEGPQIFVIWVIMIVGGSLVIAAFRFDPAFSILWLVLVGLVAGSTLVSIRIQFNADTVIERKSLFGFINLSRKVLARRKDIRMIRLVTSEGRTDDDGKPWLNNHDLYLRLTIGTLVLVQEFNESVEKEPADIIAMSKDLAHSLGVPFEHIKE